MRVNLQTGFYNNNYALKARNTSFRGEDKNDDNNKKAEIQYIPLKSDKTRTNPIYERGFDNGHAIGYDEGCEDTKNKQSKTIKAALIALAALQAANMYQGYKTDAAILDNQSEIVENQIDLYNMIDHIHSDVVFGREEILENLVGVMIMIDSLDQQRNSLKEQIEALPEDSDEAMALKEELKAIEEQYEALQEEYRDYMIKYNEQNQDSEDEGIEPDTNEPIFDGPVINLNA